MRTVGSVRRQMAARSIGSIAAVIAVVLVLSLTSVSAHAATASGRTHGPNHVTRLTTKQVRTAAAQKRAVIVVGPVGGSTTTYLTKAEAIADAAEAQGMDVTRIYHPNATWSKVVAAANGADLFVYMGHGNGWPSPYPPFQEDSKDGLGLNPSLNSTDTYNTKYYGANLIRQQIQLAPNAIVILSKLCYAEGNGEPGMPIPTEDVARQRVDNFASGFLASGAKVVFALGWQPGENIVNTLFSTTPRSMDQIFKMKFGANQDGSYKPYFGWIGWKPNVYFDSQRTSWARQHLDPDPAEGYLRGVTGDLDMTTDQWLGTVDPDDHDAPELTGLSGDQASNTIPAGEDSVPVFTPNGDKLSDSMTLRYTVSEGSFLDIVIRNSDGSAVRSFRSWSPAGAGSTVWDGRSDANKLVKDGRYDIEVTPTDRATNVGVTKQTSVKVLTAIKGPSISPILFDSSDGDGLAQSTHQKVTLTKAASITWRITNGAGDVIRRGLVDQSFPAGSASWDWDGLDDAGAQVPDGVYTSIVTATTNNGTYSHKLSVRLMPFNLKAKLKVNPGQTQTLTILTAEPVDGWPRIEIKQPGMAVYKLYPVRYTTTKFTAKWTAKAGATGPIKITITTTDSGGGTQVKTYNATLQ